MQQGRRTWGIAAAVLGLAGIARADGVRVLDELEKARTELQVQVAAVQARTADIAAALAEEDLDRTARRDLVKERAALKRLLPGASVALASLDAAIPALRRNDLREFARTAGVAAAKLHAVAKAGAKVETGAWSLDPSCAASLAGALRGALDEARTIAGASAPASLATKLSLGQAREQQGAFDRACATYLGEYPRTAALPLESAGHGPVVLKSLNGQPMSLALSVAPYSPRQTCGSCHDYATVTSGFHFDQGRAVIRDDYSVGRDGTPGYVLSDGMFGKW